MDINKNDYRIIFTNDCKSEMRNIYKYISEKLYSKNSAKKLMNKIEKNIYNLSKMPEMYEVIKHRDKLKREYRRIVVNNYIIIYTISKRQNIVYIVHIYYGKSNYLNKNINSKLF